ncbi:UNVERIFIED_CONTAM: hypothetical protein FKN15_040286 [Acipenser sinensis]
MKAKNWGNPSFPRITDPELASLQEGVLELVSDSELLEPGSLSVAEPGVTQYLLSAARLALCVWQQSPWESLPARLLQSPVYEVRLLVLQVALDQLQSPTPLPTAPYTSLLSGVGSTLETLALQETHPQCLAMELGGAMQPDLTRWAGLVAQCCEDEQPIEIKLTAAEILVSATPSLLTSTTLPLGLAGTLALWRSLFTLLQDEDQEARDQAADFIASVPPQLAACGPAVQVSVQAMPSV